MLSISEILTTRPIRIPLKKIFPTENMKNTHCKMYGYQLDTIPIFQISDEVILRSETILGRLPSLLQILKFLNIHSGFFKILGEYDYKYVYYSRRRPDNHIMYLAPANNYKNIRFGFEDLCHDVLKIESIQKLDVNNNFGRKWIRKRTCDEVSWQAILADFNEYPIAEEHENNIKSLIDSNGNKCQILLNQYDYMILRVSATVSFLIKKLTEEGNDKYIDLNYSDFCQQTNTKSSLKEYLKYMLIRMPLLDPQYLLLTPIPEIAKYIQIAIDILPYVPAEDGNYKIIC